VRPKRGVASAQNRSATNRHAIGEIYFVSGSNDAAVAKQEPWISRVNHIRIGYRVNFIHANYLRITPERNFVAAANNIQMPDADVVSDYQLLDPDKDIQMTDSYVIINPAVLRVDYAQTNTNTFADSITEKPAIEGALEKRREQGHAPEH
jgi:hypothetical protein